MKIDTDSDIIKLQDLTIRRRERILIDGINVSFPKSGLVVLLGANGAGKSSLLRLLAGVSQVTQGQVTIATDLKIAWMPEPARFYSQLTVVEQLFLQADLLALSEPKKAVEMVLAEWRLETVRNRRTAQLSLGYRQRLSLAQSLMGPVDVLLLDEPMNGMDPELMQQFKNFLIRIKQQKLVIMATHLMAEVSELADRAMVLHQGQLLAQQAFQQQNVTAVDVLYFYQNSLTNWQNKANNG